MLENLARYVAGMAFGLALMATNAEASTLYWILQNSTGEDLGNLRIETTEDYDSVNDWVLSYGGYGGDFFYPQDAAQHGFNSIELNIGEYSWNTETGAGDI